MEIECTLIHMTAKAIRVNVDGDEHWLPRSQVIFDAEAKVGDEIVVEVEDWLARERGFI